MATMVFSITETEDAAADLHVLNSLTYGWEGRKKGASRSGAGGRGCTVKRRFGAWRLRDFSSIIDHMSP